MKAYRIFPVLILLVNGCGGSGKEYQRSGAPALKLELRVASTEPIEGWTKTEPPEGEMPLFLSPKIELTNEDVVSSGVEQNDNRWSVVLRLTDSGKARMAQVTSGLVTEVPEQSTKRLAVLIDGKLICAPYVIEPVTGGVCHIVGPFSDNETEARRIAKGIVGPN